jgi:aminodeoxyfutalosine deaminase
MPVFLIFNDSRIRESGIVSPYFFDPAGFAARLDALPPSDDGLKFGLAPHAPYSTSARLYREAAALARERAWPLATHLAETRGERKLLMAGGRALTALRGAGLGAPFWPWPGCKPVEFARRVGFLERSSVPVLLAHVNYIDDDELSLLAASDASVVWMTNGTPWSLRTRTAWIMG